MYIVLFSIIFTIKVAIGTYFAYYKCMNHAKTTDAKKSFIKVLTLYYWTYKVTANTESIDIKNQTYYFFNDMMDLNDFDSSLLKIDKKSYKDIDIYYTGYITIKKIDECESIYSAKTLYLIIHSAAGHFKEKNNDKYLILDSTDKYEEVWSGIKSQIKTINVGK